MPRSFQFRRHPSGSIGCTIGLTPGVFVGAYSGSSKADALSKAGALASELLRLQASSPEVAAAFKLIPGGADAMSAIATAAKIFDSGGSKQDVEENIGTKAAKVVSDILKFF